MAGPDLPSFHGIIGRSGAMQALFRRIERVAPIDVPVLILGESGTGKELVARAIPRLSPRRERRFEIVNCGALPRELLRLVAATHRDLEAMKAQGSFREDLYYRLRRADILLVERSIPSIPSP